MRISGSLAGIRLSKLLYKCKIQIRAMSSESRLDNQIIPDKIPRYVRVCSKLFNHTRHETMGTKN
jgi:hypothetical protein